MQANLPSRVIISMRGVPSASVRSSNRRRGGGRLVANPPPSDMLVLLLLLLVGQRPPTSDSAARSRSLWGCNATQRCTQETQCAALQDANMPHAAFLRALEVGCGVLDQHHRAQSITLLYRNRTSPPSPAPLPPSRASHMLCIFDGCAAPRHSHHAFLALGNLGQIIDARALASAAPGLGSWPLDLCLP